MEIVARPHDPSYSEQLADDELMERVRAQDSAALRTLFQRYYGRVFYFVQRRLRDPGLAEEVVADVFFEVWRSADSFAGASRVSTWIFGIAHFKCAGAHRDRSRLKRASVVPTNVESLHRVADDRDLEREIGTRRELRLVRQVIEALPEEQREVLELAIVEGLPYQEIGRRLGVPEGTVKTRVSRARARLRDTLRRLQRQEGGS